MFDHHACLYTDKLDACTACTIHALPHEIKGSHREILGRSLLVIYKRFSALLHIDNIQCLLCYPVVQTVIPAMYLTSTSCPTAVRSARRKLMVRTVHIFLEEAEQSGYLFPVIIKDIVAENKKVEYHAAIAVQQHDLVVDQFGANAWDNVSYTLKEIEPVDGELGYRVKSTGKLVDKAEYEEILYEYWGNVAAQEGTSYADIFLTEGEPSENIANKRVDIIAKYSHDIPVELVTVSDSQTYEVFSSFNSKTISADGYEDFHFVIDNEDGEWKVFQGLSWAEPYPENPTGD